MKELLKDMAGGNDDTAMCKVDEDGTAYCPHCNTPLVKKDETTYHCQGDGRLVYRFPPGANVEIDKFGNLSLRGRKEEVKE